MWASSERTRGGIMAQELELLLKAKNLSAEAFRAVEGHVKSLDNAAKKNETSFARGRRRINDFGRAAGQSLAAVGKAAGIMAGAVTAAAAGVVLLAKRGSEVANVRRAFDALSGAIGETGDEILNVTRTATKGLISDMEIMEQANKGLLLGLPITADEMGLLGKTAITLGQAMKVGPEQALNDLITGLGRGSAMILDNLGITIKAKDANEQYAASIGKAVKDLTGAEKKTALYTAALAAASAKLLEIGGINLTFAERLQMVQVGMRNFIDALAEAIATSPALNRALEMIAGMMGQAFGPNQAETVKTLIGIVEGFAIGLVSLGSTAVAVGRFITNAFQGTKVIFNAVLEALVTGVSKVASMLSTLADEASALPVVGLAFKALGDTFREHADLAEALAFGFGEMKDQALDSAAGSNAAFDKVGAALEKIRAGMVAAKEAGTEFSTTFGTDTGNTATAAELAAARIVAAQNAMMAQINADYATQSAALISLVQNMYDEQLNSATTYFETYGDVAAESGLKTRAELEQTAQRAVALYQWMLQSGLYTTATLLEAYQAAEIAKQAATGETAAFQMSDRQALLSGTEGLFGVLGQKHKASAIAGAIIATYAAVAKALASAPWPFNLALAAGALAAGMANVNKIRSSKPGYRKGTPNADFVDFGPGRLEMLHGREAVITRKQGESLAEMLSSSVREASHEAARGVVLPFAPRPAGLVANRSPAEGGAAISGPLDTVADRIGRAAAQASGQPIHVHVHMDGREVADVLVQRNKAGLLPIRESSVRRF